MKLSELILAVGDDNVALQNIDECSISLDWTSKRGTKITFGTDVPLTPNGTAKLGLIVWLDRDIAQAAIDKTREA